MITVFSAEKESATLEESVLEPIVGSKPDRGDRISLYMMAIGGSTVGYPADVKLSTLSEDDLRAVRDIITLLQNSAAEVPQLKAGRSLIYNVDIRSRSNVSGDLRSIFSAANVDTIPAIFRELEAILVPYAARQDLKLKP